MTQKTQATCPLCHSNARHLQQEFTENGQHFHLWQCGQCQSLYYDPLFVADYEQHTADKNAVRDYVEANANIGILAQSVMPVVSGKPTGRMLDIGCGFGFSTDVVRRVAGWDVVGVEPSPYGHEGARLLGYHGVHEFIDAQHPLGQAQSYDVFFSAEVLEHVEDPQAFINFAKHVLKPEGVLALTTPNAAALAGAGQGERLAILSPGAHVFMASSKALEQLLAKAGFTHISIQQQGASLLAYAAMQPLKLAAIDMNIILESYYRALLAEPGIDGSLRHGIEYRAYRLLVNLGRYTDAETLAQQIDFPKLLIACPANLNEFLAHYPSHAGILHYARGMQLLNTAQYKAARLHFIAAKEICLQKLRCAPSLAIEDEGHISNATFHQALACAYDGASSEAIMLWQSLLAAPDKAMLPVAAQYKYRALKELLRIAPWQGLLSGFGLLLREPALLWHYLRHTLKIK